MRSTADGFAKGCARIALWASAKATNLTMSCVALVWCFLGLIGSGFDYSVANAAALSEDAVIGGPDMPAWSSVIGNMFLASLGSLIAGATVLALSLWITPRPAVRVVVPPQRRIYNAAD